MRQLLSIIILTLLVSLPASAVDLAAAIDQHDGGGGVTIALSTLGIEVDSYTKVDIDDMWGKLNLYTIIWIGGMGRAGDGDEVDLSFDEHKSEFLDWLENGGIFFAWFTSGPNVQKIFKLLPGSLEANWEYVQHSEVHIVNPDHPIVTEPNDISDDDWYSNWGWTATDVFTRTDGYDVIGVSPDDGDQPMWIVHPELRIGLTTIAGTWSGWVVDRIAMPENTLEYLRTLPGTQPVEIQGKLAVTWGDIKALNAQN